MAATWSEKIYEFLFAKSQHEDLVAYPNLPLLGSAFSVILFDLIYLGFVLKLGPWLMRDRKPFQLKTVLMIYNALQVIINAGILIMVSYYLIFTDYYEISCFRRLPLDHPSKWIEASVIYAGFILRYFDYLETIFFVLRKSFRQLTFLHIYHHVLVTFATYWYLRDQGFGGHGIYAAYFNTIVHVCMYSYYFVSATKPELKNSVWWKRHITELQIVQFLIILVHQSWPIFVRTDCDCSRKWLAVTISQSIVFLYLFGKFYMDTYIRKKSRKLENGYANGNRIGNGSANDKIKET